MIFLTGGSGLLGLHILEDQRDRGGAVQALARTPAAAAAVAARGATPVPGDITDPATWDRVQGVQAIVHAAALIASDAGWPAYERANVEATRLAARRARVLGVPLVHISSVAVYDHGPLGAAPGSVGEDHPTGSRTTGQYYARSKRLAEDVVREEMTRGLRAVLLRPCVVYGDGDRLFLPNVVRRARHGYFPVVGGGTRPLALVHARNVAAAVAAVLTHPAAPGNTYNVTNDGDVTGRDLLGALAEGLGHPVRSIPIPFLPAMFAAGAADLFRGLAGRSFPGLTAAVRFLRGGNPYSSHRLAAELGWQPVVGHRSALPGALRAAAAPTP